MPLLTMFLYKGKHDGLNAYFAYLCDFFLFFKNNPLDLFF